MKIVIASFLMLIIALTIHANIILVQDGSSVPNISTALKMADAGDTIKIIGYIRKDGVPAYGIQINKDIVILGFGKKYSHIAGGDDRRVFSISQGANVIISDLSIENGHSDVGGGGIENQGNLTLIRCVFTLNFGVYGGGIRNGITGNLKITECYFYRNEATLRGGGINHIGESLIIDRCNILNNKAFEEGGGIQIENANANITNSSIGKNDLMGTVNGANGAGIFIGNSIGKHKTVLANITIFENEGPETGSKAACGGGIGIISTADTSIVSIINCTIADNIASCGKGIQVYAYNFGTLNILTITNTILANGISDNFFEWTDKGYNAINCKYSIIEDLSMNDFGNNNLNNTDPLFDSLQWIQTYFQVYSLLPNSPAIDAGTDTGVFKFDQRGCERIGRADIGAFEYGGIVSFPSGKELVCGLKVYPNPTQGIINIAFNAIKPIQLKITLRSIEGKELEIIKPMQDLKVGQNDIHVMLNQSFPEGIYLLEFQTDDGQFYIERILILNSN